MLTKSYRGSSKQFVISDTAMLKYATLFDTLDQSFAFQPIQILYFNKDKKLTSFHANCLAAGSGLGKLDWNIEDRFQHYIPITAADITYENWDLHDLFTQVGIDHLEIPENREIVVLLWSRLLNKQIKSAHEIVIANIEKHLAPADFPTIFYLNTDKLYAALHHEKINQAFIKEVLTDTEYAKYRARKESKKGV